MLQADMNRYLEHPIIKEERGWETAADQTLGQPAELISVSPYVADSRVYGNGGQVAKIRFRRSITPSGVGTLDAEGRILRHLGQDVEYSTTDEWEAIVLNRIHGTTLEQTVRSSPLRERLKLTIRLLPELQRIHAKHIAHRDLRLDNVLIDSYGKLHLVDFDRATIGTRLSVELSDWLGLSPQGISPYPFWLLALFTLFPKSRGAIRRIRARAVPTRRKSPSASEDPEIDLLENAWLLAQQSPANSAGQSLAYYSFTYKGHHFPGERPWYLRWEPIRRVISFKGKRVLELGSNMGLFSSFAAIHGAKQVVGVDQDPTIVRAARLVAEALGANATFHCIDLARDMGWESMLRDSDMVIAMSVLRWLPDQDRVLRFLGSAPEILYEGHDGLELEMARLRSAGFTNLSVVAGSDRGRFVVHGMNR